MQGNGAQEIRSAFDPHVARLTGVSSASLFARHGVTPRRLGVAMLALLVAVAAMLLSAQQMSDLRDALPPLSQAMNWLEMLPLPLDMDHVVFFAFGACGLRLLLPRVRVWWLLLGLLALAVGTELLQFMTDGRTPRVLDVRDDMLGACLGLLVGSLPLWAAPQSRAMLRLGDIALLAGIVLLPVQQWSQMHALSSLLVAPDTLFVIALGVRGFALLGGRAPLALSAFHAWLTAYVLAMLLPVLVVWAVCTGPVLQWLACSIQSPELGGAISQWIGVVYLALVAAMACDAMHRTHVTGRTALGSIVVVFMATSLLIVLLIWLLIGDLSGGMQSLTQQPDIWLNKARRAGPSALVALAGLCGWLVWRGGGCAWRADGVSGGLLVAFVAAFAYSGLTGRLEDSPNVWLLMGMLAGSCMACARHTVRGHRSGVKNTGHD